MQEQEWLSVQILCIFPDMYKPQIVCSVLRAHEQKVGYFSKKPPGENLISPAVFQQKFSWLKERRNAYGKLASVTNYLKNITSIFRNIQNLC